MNRIMSRVFWHAFVICCLLSFGHTAHAFDAPGFETPVQENRSLEEIYRAALAEGGTLVVYAGGDVPDGNAATEKAFRERFPGINIRIITDLSKYHDMRIDQQLALGQLECDVAHL